MSPDERAAEIKQAMLRSMDGLRNQYAEELVVRGLAQPDSERVVEEFAAGIAGCLLEAGRKDAEARGYTVDEFLHGAKMIWTNSFNSSIDLKHLPPSTASCAINVSQQAGLPLAVGFEPRQASGNEPTLAVASANGPGFDQTEATIRDHIAKHPEIALTDLLVHCQAMGCEILMQGRDIRIFDLEFDVFAEQNGFRSAVVGGDAGFRTVWLQR